MTVFSDLITSASTSARTVTLSNGLMGWAGHNLFINSGGPVTTGVPVVSGFNYTLAFKGTGSIVYSGAASGTLDGIGEDELVSVEVLASTATLTCTISGSITVVRVYGSDLGGMQVNAALILDPTYYPTQGLPYFAPAFDYNPVTLGFVGVRVEPEITNLLLHSNDLADALWVKASGLLAVENQALGPSGLTDLIDISGDGINAFSRIEQFVSSSGQVVFSVIAKNKTSDQVTIRLEGTDVSTPASSNSTYKFTFSTETFSKLAGGDAATSFEALGGGLYRISLIIPSSTTITRCVVYPEYGASIGNGVYIGYTQVEAGEVATSYTPTTAAVVLRSTDNLFMTNGVLPFAGYSQDEGTVVVEYNFYFAVGFPRICSFNTDAGNKIELLTTSAGSAKMFIQDLGSTEVNSTLDTNVLNSDNKISLGWELNNVSGSHKGLPVVTDLSATLPAINGLQIGARPLAITEVAHGHIKSIIYYNTRLTNDQIERLSS